MILNWEFLGNQIIQGNTLLIWEKNCLTRLLVCPSKLTQDPWIPMFNSLQELRDFLKFVQFFTFKKFPEITQNYTSKDTVLPPS